MAAAAAKTERELSLIPGLTKPEFRKQVLMCGNMTQAAYDAFDSDSNSATAGMSLYSKEELLPKVGVQDASKYRIHSFLYANTGVPALAEQYITQPRGLNITPGTVGFSNWIGYVAYGSEEEIAHRGLEIYVALRGTQTLPEWISNLGITQSSARALVGDPHKYNVPADATVHSGWLSLYNSTTTVRLGSLRDQIHASVKSLIEKYKRPEASTHVFVTGHSLGGALATMAAYDLAVSTGYLNTNVAAFVFSTPPCGNAAFQSHVARTGGLRILHVSVDGDVVPAYATLISHDFVPIQEAGLRLAWQESPYLTFDGVLEYFITIHNLEVVLHLLAGYNPTGPFHFLVKRSPVLINKYTGAYKGAPAKWWYDKVERKKQLQIVAQGW